MDEHWHDADFAVLKIDLHNTFNRVSRQAILDACGLHFLELLPWSSWCYGQHLALWHPLGTITSEIGVQQGDPPRSPSFLSSVATGSLNNCRGR